MNTNMKGWLPFVGMVVCQFTQVGLTLANKKAIEAGMHNFSFIFYSNALASLFLLPAALIINRPPALTFPVAGCFVGLGILGFLMQVVGYVGVTYASTTVVTAILNLIPGFAFAFALIFGLERVKNGGGLAKITGTLVSVAGALIVTFYMGPAIINSRLTSISLAHSSDMILGGMLMLFDSVLAALFIVAQALTLKKYPAVLILMSAYCSIIAILSLLASFTLEHHLDAFTLHSKTRILSVLYSGLFGGGFQLTIGGWCMKIKGPLFVAIFQPLGIVIAAVSGVLFLGDGLYLGCVVGSVVIVIGFYGVMWGKAKEEEDSKIDNSKSPLLQHNTQNHNDLA